jgi:hypothetical protein
MRKILGLFFVLALYFGVTAGYVSAQGRTVRVVPGTTSGSPVPAGFIKLAGPDDHSLVTLKAQNHLSSAMKQRLTKEKTGLGGTMSNPGIKNGTVNTVPYFNSWFITGTRNSIYTYSMVGHSPKVGGTTGIDNQVIPLITVLLKTGSALYVFDPTATNDPQGTDIDLFAQSPLYDATTTYPGNGGSLPSDMGQLVDTGQRAEFTGVRTPDWHTPLNVPISSGIVWIQFLEYDNGDWACVGGEAPPCTSFPVVSINVISNNFAFILNVEAPLNTTVPIIVTDFVTAFDTTIGNCCILGYHTAQPGIVDPTGILVWTWGTFLPHSNNPFAPFGNDVMVLSHELSELYNDPFVNTSVSPWVDGSVSFAQANLETGDAVEAMHPADVIYPAPLTTTGGPYTYNLQNVAILQWFTRNPIGPVTGPGPGVYSWPNTNVLNNGHDPSGPCGPNPGCWGYGEGSAGFFFGPPY